MYAITNFIGWNFNMKKFLKITFAFMALIFLASCNKDNTSDLISSMLPENVATDVFETNSKEETTTNQGIIQNSAGIIVREDVRTINSSNVNITVRTNIPEEERGLGAAIEASYYADEDAKRLGVSKILVMQLDSSSVYMLEKEIFSKINELLVTKYGCDFVVSFVGLNEFVSKYRFDSDITSNNYIWIHEYDDNLQFMKEKKQPVDIITSVYDVTNYSTLVSDGYLEDITDYLMTTEEGGKFYNAFPKETWDAITRDGRIYGYSKGSMFTYYVDQLSVMVLNCNKNMAEKLSIEIENGFSFYNIGDILENANLPKEMAEEVVLLYLPKEYLYRMFGYYDVGCGIFAKKDADGNWVAFNGTENEEFIRLWKTLRTYNEKGWLRTDRTSRVEATKGEALFSVYEYNLFDNGIENYPLGEMEDKILMKEDVSKGKTLIYDVILGETYYEYMDIQEDVYGITTWSEHKEEALKFITLLNTEPELANLYKFGLEGIHYEYTDEDNQMKYLQGTKQVSGRRYAPVNQFITYPVYLEPDNKLDFYKEEFTNFEKSPFLEYEITVERKEELREIYDPECVLYQIYDQGYAKLMSGEYEDVDAAVAEIKRIQKEAGIDEYISAINAEFEKCRNK